MSRYNNKRVNSEENYIEINKQSWNKKTDFHIASEFYDNEKFIQGQSSLNDVEINLLGDINGKSVLHLQCHFGQDTISLTRLGAKATGVDLSDKAIGRAKELALKTESDTQFVCCDLYSLPDHLDGQFDIVYTSYGTIGWLPDMNKWASIIAHFLKPGGRFIFVEFHPVVWMFDDDFYHVKYSYFNVEPIIEMEEGTYADTNAPIKQECITWNHPISEVVNSLLKNGLEINSLNEYNYSPYDCFNNTIEIAPKKYRIEQLENKLPMLYSLVTTKK